MNITFSLDSKLFPKPDQFGRYNFELDIYDDGITLEINDTAIIDRA